MSKIISCASYYGCGSSAITDLVSEYKGVKSLTEYEFRFIQDTDGLMDLYYHLVKAPNRHNSGHALKRFWKLSKFNSGTWFDKRYERFFHGNYKRITKEYVDSLTQLAYKGFWFMDMYDKGPVFYYIKSIEWKILKKLRLDKKISIMPKEFTLCPIINEDKFLELTRQYLKDLLSVVTPSDAEYLMMDQLTPSSNINECLKFFDDDFRTVVVDRDPRDIYASNMMIWNEGIVPTNPKDFCIWFDFTRSCAKGQKYDIKRVLKLQFEDIVYKYNETVARVERFLELDPKDHERPFQGMNPKRSVVNTQLFKRYPKQDEIRYIEEHLREYLFDFESVSNNEIVGVQPKDTHSF